MIGLVFCIGIDDFINISSHIKIITITYIKLLNPNNVLGARLFLDFETLFWVEIFVLFNNSKLLNYIIILLSLL